MNIWESWTAWSHWMLLGKFMCIFFIYWKNKSFFPSLIFFITPAACSSFIAFLCEEHIVLSHKQSSIHPTMYIHMHTRCCCIHCCCRDRKWRESYHSAITPCWWWSSDHEQRQRWKHSDPENRTLSQPNQYTPVYCIDSQNRKQSYSVCSPHMFSLLLSIWTLSSNQSWWNTCVLCACILCHRVHVGLHQFFNQIKISKNCYLKNDIVVYFPT